MSHTSEPASLTMEPMSPAKNDVDVLIAGAGPVGLLLANECARRGLTYRIVESRATQSQHSKALAIFPRTLEILDMAGLAGPFLEAANRVTWVSVISHGHRLAHMKFEPTQSPYPFVAMVPQNVTEQLLLEALRRQGGDVEYLTAFESAVEQDGGVSVTLDHQGSKRQLTAAYVVGCDGAHSAVRHLLNLPFEGAEYTESFLLADVETNDALPANELQLCPSDQGPVAIFPMSATRRRVVAMIDHAEGDAPSLELLRQILAERAPLGIELHSLNWSGYFSIHHRQASRLRVGRMFIAGDAAHIHSPFGGQGMNTGMHDVWNLVWKLDLALRGLGNEELLASYTAERRPVIKQVIEMTDFLTKALGTPSKLAQILRDAIIPMVSPLAPFQHAFVRRLSELGVAYQGSPIVEGAGERYWDESLRGGNGIRSRYLLMLDQGAEPAFTQAAGKLVESFREVVELRQRSGPEVTLVRPDGYIAYSTHSEKESALQQIRTLLERQTRQTLRVAN